MNERPLLDEPLRRLRLPTARGRYAQIEQEAIAGSWSYAEYLGRVAEEELAHRHERRIARLVTQAHFPFLKSLEEFDFTFPPSPSRRALGPYLGVEFVASGRNLILYGPSGTGKTALSIALSYQALLHGATVLFVTCTELIGDLVQARARNEWEKALARYLTCEVLVIDEVGYLSYGPYAANVLFPVIDKRYLKGDRPILLTTNKDPAQWEAVLHDADLAQAILDRLLHKGEILKMEGPSYRRHRPGQPVGREAAAAAGAEK
jgi:DNA replication protein DnaC